MDQVKSGKHYPTQFYHIRFHMYMLSVTLQKIKLFKIIYIPDYDLDFGLFDYSSPHLLASTSLHMLEGCYSLLCQL